MLVGRDVSVPKDQGKGKLALTNSQAA
jgi:hypothetical protein